MCKYVVLEFGRNIDGVIKSENACSWQELNSYPCIYIYKTPDSQYFLSEEDARLHIVSDLLHTYNISYNRSIATEMLCSDLGSKLYKILGEFYG